MTVYTKISELPSAGAIADSDVFILNDADVTSKYTYGNLKVAVKDYIISQDLTFSGTVTLSGAPVAPTATSGTNTTQIATTEFVTSAIATGPVSSLTQTALDLKAPLASPAFTGTPIAPTPSASDNSTKVATTAYVDSAISAEALGVFAVRPVVTAVDAPAVDQGVLWTAQQLVDDTWPGIAWYFYDYTGTANSHNKYGTSGVVGGIENTPGSYTIKGRAAWNFGISEEVTINVTVNSFTLNRDTMFGGLSGLQASIDTFYQSSWSNDFLAIVGAVVENEGVYTFDTGTLVADTANCIAFWSYTEDVLLAFRYDSGDSLVAPAYWPNAATLPEQGTTLANTAYGWTSTTTQQTAANNSSVLGKRVPFGGFYKGGLASSHYLSITPAGTEFNGFGGNDTDWSYGFVLTDDWIASSTANQLLAPTGISYFINTVAGFGIGSSPYEYVHYGNETIATDTSTTEFDISTRNWLIASAGDLVVVTYDGTGTDTWKIYVEGTLLASSTAVDTYMDSNPTVTELRLGDSGSSAETAYPLNYNELGGWYARLDSIFVATGTAFDQTQVTELTADKADLTTSDNYGDVTTLATFDGSGVTSVKGSATYARGDLSFPVTRALANG